MSKFQKKTYKPYYQAVKIDFMKNALSSAFCNKHCRVESEYRFEHK